MSKPTVIPSLVPQSLCPMCVKIRTSRLFSWIKDVFVLTCYNRSFCLLLASAVLSQHNQCIACRSECQESSDLDIHTVWDTLAAFVAVCSMEHQRATGAMFVHDTYHGMISKLHLFSRTNEYWTFFVYSFEIVLLMTLSCKYEGFSLADSECSMVSSSFELPADE